MEKFTVRLTEDDDDIKKVISELKGKKLSSFVRQAIRFYIQFSDQIDNIQSDVQKILEKLDSKGFDGVEITKYDVLKKGIEETETDKGTSILIDSIQSLIEL